MKKSDDRLEKKAKKANLPNRKFGGKALKRVAHPKHPKVTAFDLVKDLCGSLNGPSDLATNPKYLSF